MDYIYRAELIKVLDGDTVRVLVDCGFSITVQKTLRLKGINTPELRSGTDRERAKQARDRLKELLEGKKLTIQTFRDKNDKYGRMLADIYIEGEERTANQILTEEGFAVAYDGGKR